MQVEHWEGGFGGIGAVGGTCRIVGTGRICRLDWKDWGNGAVLELR